MRVYEELFILKPDTPEEDVETFIGQIKDLIANGQGVVEKAERWGGNVRKLAYRVQKYNEGIYVLVQFSSPADLVKEIERRLRVTDTVIKFITVRVDERMKKIEKRRKARAKRAARKPPPQVAAPAAPAASEPGPAPGLPGMPAAPAEPKAEPKVEPKGEPKGEPVTQE